MNLLAYIITLQHESVRRQQKQKQTKTKTTANFAVLWLFVEQKDDPESESLGLNTVYCRSTQHILTTRLK